MHHVKRNPKEFGRLLKTAVRKIALQQNKNIAMVQDELGYNLDRDSGGAAIQYWERGNIPAKKQDVEKLKQQLSSHQVPKGFGYLNTFPKTSSGKTDWIKIKKLLEADPN